MALYYTLFLGFMVVAFVYAFFTERLHRHDPKGRMIEGLLFHLYRYIGIVGLAALCFSFMFDLVWLQAIWQVLLLPAAFFIGVYLGDMIAYGWYSISERRKSK